MKSCLKQPRKRSTEGKINVALLVSLKCEVDKDTGVPTDVLGADSRFIGDQIGSTAKTMSEAWREGWRELLMVCQANIKQSASRRLDTFTAPLHPLPSVCLCWMETTAQNGLWQTGRQAADRRRRVDSHGCGQLLLAAALHRFSYSNSYGTGGLLIGSAGRHLPGMSIDHARMKKTLFEE